MNPITLKLDPKELDYIWSVLASRPYAECVALMDNIKTQVMQHGAKGENPTVDPALRVG